MIYFVIPLSFVSNRENIKPQTPFFIIIQFIISSKLSEKLKRNSKICEGCASDNNSSRLIRNLQYIDLCVSGSVVGL